ncbi:hypothetical protein D3C80_168050 [compost metagenome]
MLAMTDRETFLAHLLAKPGSSLACRDDECTTVEIQHFSAHSGSYPTSTTRFAIYEDGRVMTWNRDDVEGADFRERNRYLLKNVTLLAGSKQVIDKLGWE